MRAWLKIRDFRSGGVLSDRCAVSPDGVPDNGEHGKLQLRRDDGSASGGLTALIPAGLMLFAGLGGLAFASLLADGVEGQFVVVSPPWQAAVHLVTRADGALLAGGGFRNVIVAASDRPGFADDLRAAGAWLVFPAPRALGCGTPDQTSVQAGRGGAGPAFQKTIQDQTNRQDSSDAV